MRIHNRLLIALMCVLSVPAAAEFVTATEAYEIELTHLNLPQASTGSMTFRRCDTCDPQTVRVTVSTRYIANGADYSLADYRRLLAGIRQRDDKFMTVKHHLASDTIKSIRVSL